jgi:hypothetical protein
MEFAISVVSNAVAVIVCNPIDVVKTNVQTQNMNIRTAFTSMFKNRMFFKGLSPNLFAQPVFWGVFFQTRELINKNLDSPLLELYISANIASFIANPLYVMKIQYQTCSTRPISFKSLFAGFPATTVNNMKLGLQFTMYEKLRDNYNIGISSIISKGIATSMLYPFDLVRVKQRKNVNGVTMLSVFENIYSKFGLAGFYKGIIMYNLVSTLQFTVMMYAIEYCNEF